MQAQSQSFGPLPARSKACDLPRRRHRSRLKRADLQMFFLRIRCCPSTEICSCLQNNRRGISASDRQVGVMRRTLLGVRVVTKFARFPAAKSARVKENQPFNEAKNSKGQLPATRSFSRGKNRGPFQRLTTITDYLLVYRFHPESVCQQIRAVSRRGCNFYAPASFRTVKRTSNETKTVK